MRTKILIIFTLMIIGSCGKKEQKEGLAQLENLVVRISEIEVFPMYLDEYVAILKEEAEASVRLEPGVISIYPMFVEENASQIRILEIYLDEKAYKDHLQTPHFKHYKSSTLKMVKSLKLIDMESMDKETMPYIFKKLER